MNAQSNAWAQISSVPLVVLLCLTFLIASFPSALAGPIFQSRNPNSNYQPSLNCTMLLGPSTGYITKQNPTDPHDPDQVFCAWIYVSGISFLDGTSGTCQFNNVFYNASYVLPDGYFGGIQLPYASAGDDKAFTFLSPSSGGTTTNGQATINARLFDGTNLTIDISTNITIASPTMSISPSYEAVQGGYSASYTVTISASRCLGTATLYVANPTINSLTTWSVNPAALSNSSATTVTMTIDTYTLQCPATYSSTVNIGTSTHASFVMKLVQPCVSRPQGTNP